MQRFIVKPRANWQKTVETQGFIFHSVEGEYWDESACYAFEESEIDQIESATNDLHGMCLEAVEHVISSNKLSDFAIPAAFHPAIIKSWENKETSIYGRFDLAVTESGEIKMLEYNADTPTSLLEASVIQWYWLQDFNKDLDQFNSIHEKLLASFQQMRTKGMESLHFSCVAESDEDYMTTAYLLDCATQSGLRTQLLDMGEIGWDKHRFLDTSDQPIPNMFKLYPWEFMFEEEFGQHILQANTRWIEPMWKSILSNKMILKVLWDLFPKHPNLLRCTDHEGDMKSYVKKPLLSREGANITIVERGDVAAATKGEYGIEGFIYQEYIPLPEFGGRRPVVGSWVIQGESAGIGIRETKTLVHDNFSSFVPHYFS